MSTEQQPLDPRLIEETKQQIKTLVNEIAQLSKSDIAPEQFYGEFLPRVVSALAAVGGAFWTIDQGRLALGYQVNIQETKLKDRPDAQVQHGKLLHQVLQKEQPALVAPQAGVSEAEGEEAGNPTDFLLVLGPIRTDLETVGLVEVFQRPDTAPATQQGYLNFLAQMCDLAGDYFKSRQLRSFSDRQTLWSQLEDFTLKVHQSLDPREAAYTIANEGRRLIECDRVSVALRRGRHSRIEAVSGQDLFDKRSNTVRLLGELATAVVAAGEPIWYTGDTTDMAPQVEEAVQEYVDESHSKTVAVLPLYPPLHEHEQEEIDERQPVPDPVGALIVEQIEDSRVPERMRQRVDVVGSHSATALSNAMEHDTLFLMPLWRTLGKSRVLVKAKHLPKTISISVAVVGLLLALIFVPWKFKLRGEGTFEPVLRRDVYAQIDGRVIDLEVTHRSGVKAGQVLARLENLSLGIEIDGVVGELAKTQNLIDSNASELATRLTRERRTTLLREQALAEEDLVRLPKQLAGYRAREKHLEVRAPIDGIVTSWDPETRLMNRRVAEGDVMLHVIDPTKGWKLEVRMPDKRMGPIERYRRRLKNEDPSDDLVVEYIIEAIDPGKSHTGRVSEIQRNAEVMGEEGNMVLLKVDIDSEELLEYVRTLHPDAPPEKLDDLLRSGTGVTAKVYCGYRPLGYTIFHDAIAFFQSRVWFRFF